MKISIINLKNLTSVAGFQYKKEEDHFSFAFPAKVTTGFPESDAPRLTIEPLVFHINPVDWPYFVVAYSDIFSIQSCSQELEMAHERIFEKHLFGKGDIARHYKEFKELEE